MYKFNKIQDRNSSDLNNTTIPIVVDLDGTLTPTDTLVESIIKLIKDNPLIILYLCFLLLRGKFRFKEFVSVKASIAVEYLPYRINILKYLAEEKSKGRLIVLATAAHYSIANKVANHLKIFDLVLASENGINLKGVSKLFAINSRIGYSFVYIGDSIADLPIWKAAKSAILVDASAYTSKIVRQHVRIECEYQTKKAIIWDWFKALRVHQWAKNFLMFVPLLTSFSFFEVGKFWTLIIAFLSFSLAASSTYICNDLWDLQNDRVHPRKSMRPFACGSIPIVQGIFVAAVSISLSIILALMVSHVFFIVLLIYIMITTAYSLYIKKLLFLDVLFLSMLYTLRIIAGTLAIEISTSIWLLAFSSLLFLSLALLKRVSELVNLEKNEVLRIPGRDYYFTDLVVLLPLGIGASFSAVVVLWLFITDSDTISRYSTPQLLWLVPLAITYWLARIWILTSRGKMHDDPVIFAIKDIISLCVILFTVLLMLLSHYLILVI